LGSLAFVLGYFVVLPARVGRRLRAAAPAPPADAPTAAVPVPDAAPA
jgi:hypothetical protein